MKIVKFTDMTIVKKEGENRQIDFVLMDLIFISVKTLSQSIHLCILVLNQDQLLLRHPAEKSK